MARSKAIKSLAKVLIAAAWVDGKVSNDEVNSLKDLLFHLPEMTASDWAELDIYIETPVGVSERTRLVMELQDALRSRADKALAHNALTSLASADGDLSAEEQAIIASIKTAIDEVSTGIMGGLGRLLGNSLMKRSSVIANTPNRELFLDDYIKNKVYYLVSRRLELGQTSIEIPEKELRRLSLAGGLMARVAYVDREVHPSEFEAMIKAIQDNWSLSEVEAALVAEVAVSAISKGMDYYRLSRRFFESTTETERIRFMDVLFAVADGDGFVSNQEIEEIRTIANVLKLTHKQFINAKLKIPRARRAN